ncbi:MAG: hypothetical protein HYR76_08305 [Ignavibacteria bacterium]|nr:hypothetical protein [Ignavibacteria bacterium]
MRNPEQGDKTFFIKIQCSLVLAALVSVLGGCSQKKGQETANANTQVVIALEGDIDSFNPLFAEDVAAGEINDLFFPGLTTSRFDTVLGVLEYEPSLAKSWEYENGNKDIRFHLQTNARWQDSTKMKAKDVEISYELYADTSVASIRQASVDGLRRTSSGSLDVSKAVEVVDDSTILFHFDHPYPGQLFDAGLPILPSHVFQNLPRTSMREQGPSRQPLSAGPFVLKSWKPLEEIVITSNPLSVVPHSAKLSEVIFRIIPDYHSRLMQLRAGEVDVLPYIEVEDALELAHKNMSIRIVPLGERFYDAINWNSIDPEEYQRSKGKVLRPHYLFGTARVRKALTLAINRKEIVDSYLRSYGKEAIGPISPLFRWAYNDTLKPLPFDPSLASKLLYEEGWRDTDGDGVLEKDARKFSFALRIPAGNQLRATIASIVQRQLSAMKIRVTIEQVERSVFWSDLMEKKFDACIAGFSVPLQLQLDEWWSSDLERSRFNLTSFRNKRVDEILAGTRRIVKETDHANAWKEFQTILQDEQPCTFLYWMNDLVAVNTRIQGIEMGILGIAYHAGDWYVGDQRADDKAQSK